jgi:acyl dehydratase
MPLNPAFAGRVYAPTEPYLVGREKIREFAAAIGDTNPVHSDVAAARREGHPDLVAPPTFPVLLTMNAEYQVMFDPELGLDIGRLLHREQRFRYRRAVHATDELTVTVAVTGLDLVDGHDVLTLTSEINTTDGEHVCDTTSVLFARGPDGMA